LNFNTAFNAGKMAVRAPNMDFSSLEEPFLRQKRAFSRKEFPFEAPEGIRRVQKDGFVFQGPLFLVQWSFFSFESTLARFRRPLFREKEMLLVFETGLDRPKARI
jgi:hypothetical protein